MFVVVRLSIYTGSELRAGLVRRAADAIDTKGAFSIVRKFHDSRDTARQAIT